MVPFFIAFPILDDDQIIVVDFLHMKKQNKALLDMAYFFDFFYAIQIQLS
jgi:hypothetical protein